MRSAYKNYQKKFVTKLPHKDNFLQMRDYLIYARRELDNQCVKMHY